MAGIGLLNEKPLHASLKAWYARPGDRYEVEVDGFVIDIVRGDLLLEIQTGHLASIRDKLATLAAAHRIRLIYPIAQQKRIIKLARDDGARTTARRSPKRGRFEDLFWEMVSFPQLLANPNFAVEVLLIEEEEVRRYEGTRSWRRRGWVIEERRLLDVVDRRLYEQPTDWRAFLPDGIDAFTAKELAQAIGIRNQLAQKMVYCLRKVQVIEWVGNRGRAHLYQVSSPKRQMGE